MLSEKLYLVAASSGVDITHNVALALYHVYLVLNWESIILPLLLPNRPSVSPRQ